MRAMWMSWSLLGEAAQHFSQDRIIAIDVAGESSAEVGLVSKSKVGRVPGRVGAGDDFAEQWLRPEGSQSRLLFRVSFAATPAEIGFCTQATEANPPLPLTNCKRQEEKLG